MRPVARINERYIVDKNGRKKAVMLDIAYYRTLLQHLEDLEDAEELRSSGRL